MAMLARPQYRYALSWYITKAKQHNETYVAKSHYTDLKYSPMTNQIYIINLIAFTTVFWDIWAN